MPSAGPETVSRLARLSRRLLQLGEHEVHDEALDCLRDVLGVERSSVLVFDRDGVMRFRAWRGISKEYRAAVEGHSPWTPETVDPHPILVRDVYEDEALSSYRAVFEAESIRALAFFPLIARRRVVGKFMLYFDEPRELDDFDVEIAKIVAAHVGYAVERSEAEERLQRKTRELEEVLARKDQFMAILGHELRSPLSASALAIDYMARQPEHAAVFARERAILGRQLSTVRRLVDDLLDLSRIERGTLRLDRERIAVREIVEGAVEVCRPQIEGRRHELHVDVPGDIHIEADRGRMVQAVANLLDNAAKYTDPGGRIVVEGWSEGGSASVAVADSGPGIASDALDALFIPFQRGETTRGDGLGIGLSIVKHISELHGGRVVARSDGPGTGSRFVVTLPLAAARASTAPVEDLTP